MEGSAIQSPFLMIGAAVGRDEGQLQLVWKARMIKSANSVRWSHSGSENRHELASKLWRAAGVQDCRLWTVCHQLRSQKIFGRNIDAAGVTFREIGICGAQSSEVLR